VEVILVPFIAHEILFFVEGKKIYILVKYFCLDRIKYH
jgi:hypothetical protein